MRRARRARSVRERAPSDSVVELGGLLGGLEQLRIVADEQLGVVDITDVPDLLVGLVHAVRALCAGNRWNQILLKALREVDAVAGENDRPGLGKLDHHELAAWRMAGRTDKRHAPIVEQVEVAFQ